MHIYEVKSPVSIVGKFKMYGVDLSSECKTFEWRERKEYVSQFENAFNSALIKATGEDLCHGFTEWPSSRTSLFSVTSKHLDIFEATLREVAESFSYVKADEYIPPSDLVCKNVPLEGRIFSAL